MDLFVYGSLLFPEVLTALLHRVPQRTPARTTGWRAAALPGRLYPGLVRHESGTTSGLVLGGLSPAENQLLDEYEGSQYRRGTVTLTSGQDCHAYVWLAEVLPDDWSSQVFAAEHLDGYVRNCRRWRADRPR